MYRRNDAVVPKVICDNLDRMRCCSGKCDGCYNPASVASPSSLMFIMRRNMRRLRRVDIRTSF
jgi:hypothetical protein